MASKEILSKQDTEAGLANTGFEYKDDRLVAEYKTKAFSDGAALVAAIAVLADAANHHPDIELGYGRVGVTLTSHDAGGVTARDVALAKQIADAATQAGVRRG